MLKKLEFTLIMLRKKFWNYGSHCCPIVTYNTKRQGNFQVILYSASWKFIKTQNSSKRRAHASLKFHVLWCNQIPDSSSRGLSEITLQHSKVTELSFIAMFLNNENIKISRRVRERIYCKSMQMTAVCQARAISHERTWKIAINMHKRLDSKALRQVMAVGGRANGSKELIDNQGNDDEIEQADARNKNNDWRESRIMLTCKGALTMIIYL